MKIKEVQIKGLFGKKDILWQLNPQVNVLIGENGSGKSTILTILNNLLREESTNNILRLVDIFTIITPNNEKIIAKTSSHSEFDNELQDFLSEIKQKYGIETNIENNFNYFVKYSENIHELMHNSHIDLIEANLTNSNANHIIQKSNQEKTNALDMEIRETIHELNKIQSQSNEIIDRLITSLNFFFNMIGKQVDYKNFELIYKDSQLNKELSYSDLSSGERQLIYILLRVALSNADKNKTAIILMDEPEISLHINWQAHFIKQLTLLNPDAQFIIVTHSPAIVMNGWNDVYVNMEEITQ